jgi:hypothetical protein
MISDIINQNLSINTEESLVQEEPQNLQNVELPDNQITKETSDRIFNYLIDELNFYKKANAELESKNAELESKLNKTSGVELLLKLKENLAQKQKIITENVEYVENTEETKPELKFNSNNNQNIIVTVTEQEDNLTQQSKPKKRPTVFGRRF